MVLHVYCHMLVMRISLLYISRNLDGSSSNSSDVSSVEGEGSNRRARSMCTGTCMFNPQRLLKIAIATLSILIFYQVSTLISSRLE